MVHEIHLGVIVAAITILVPTVVLASSAGPFSLIGDSPMANVVQGAEAATSQTSIKMPVNQNAMETLEQLYTEQAFAEITRCSGSNDDGSMCAETIGMLIATCDDSSVKRIAACDDPRLQEYRNRA